jgi:hypothetical protein
LVRLFRLCLVAARMSSGSPHYRPNLKHPGELTKILSEGGAPQLMQRWKRLDIQHDVPDLCGYDVWGTVAFADKDFFRALTDPAYAEQIVGAAIDTGLKPEQTLDCLIGLPGQPPGHEKIEKVLLDADNPIDTYEAAHEYATSGEHEKVRAHGSTPLRYERGLDRIIRWCEKKIPKAVSRWYACAPYLDEEDKQDAVTLKVLKTLGVQDAFKASMAKAGYTKSTSAARCSGCASWQGPRNTPLALCKLVEGLVRTDRVCGRFESMEGTNGGIQGGNLQPNT